MLAAGVPGLSVAAGTPGVLDASFSGDGYATTDISVGHGGAGGDCFGSGPEIIEGAEFTSAGKLVVGGFALSTPFLFANQTLKSPDVALARYLPNGELDPDFGTGGTVLWNFGSVVGPDGNQRPTDECVYDMVLDQQGRIVVAGAMTEWFPANGGGVRRPFLARFTSAGAPDATFGAGGLLNLSQYTADNRVRLAEDGDGSLVVDAVLPEVRDLDGNIVQPSYATLVRVTSAGQLDPTLQTMTYVNIERDPYGQGDTILDFVVMPDGDLATVGYRHSHVLGWDTVFWRANPDGSRDLGFGDNGSVMVSDYHLGGGYQHLAAGPDGTLVATGTAALNSLGDDITVIRLTATGQRDPLFGVNGVVETHASHPDSGNCDNHETGEAVHVMPDQRILVTGTNRTATCKIGFALIRYLPDGSLDETFAGNGIVADGFFPNPEFTCAVQYLSSRSRALAVDPANGDIAVAGQARVGDTCYVAAFAVARYSGGGPVETTPPTGSVTIDAGATATSTRAVTLTLSATDAWGVPDMRLRNSGDVWGPWQPYATSAAWQLTDSDGPHTLEAQFRDTHANLSLVASATVVLDRTAPTLSAVTINSGDAWATSAPVTVTVSGTDLSPGSGVAQMRLRNDDLAWSAWRPYAATSDWTMPATDGTHEVHVTIRDAAGNLSGTAADSIGLDQTAPSLSVTLESGAPYTRSLTVTVDALASDGTGSGVDAIRFKTVFGDWTPWVSYTSPRTWTLEGLDGIQPLSVQVRDRAGRVSSTETDSITLDRIRPTGTLSINRGAAVTHTRRVRLSLRGKDVNGSGVSQVRVRNGSGAWSGWRPYTRTQTWKLRTGYGTKVLWAQYRDRAGNVSTAVRDRINYRP